MSTDEQMAIIGRMVTERKDLRVRQAALVDQLVKACKGFDALSRSLEDCTRPHGGPLNLPESVSGFLNADKLRELIDELQSTRAELRGLDDRLKQAGIE